jgi:hypothetical protein
MWKAVKVVMASKTFRAAVALLLLVIAEVLTSNGNEGDWPTE